MRLPGAKPNARYLTFLEGANRPVGTVTPSRTNLTCAVALLPALSWAVSATVWRFCFGVGGVNGDAPVLNAPVASAVPEPTFWPANVKVSGLPAGKPLAVTPRLGAGGVVPT